MKFYSTLSFFAAMILTLAFAFEGAHGQTCSPGTYGTGGMTPCTDCPIGEYQPNLGSTSCLLCPVGSYQSLPGSTHCVSCPIGKYQASTGQSACLDCEVGKFGTFTGSSVCTSCPIGKYQPSTGQSACLDCQAGKYGAFSGSTACENCPAGFAQPNTGSTNCVACLKGTFSTAGAINCANCAAGTYSALDQATSCTQCSPGTYQTNSGSTNCLDCAIGTYASVQGSSACISCNAGTFNTIAGSSNCNSCSAGSFQSVTGSSSCALCSAGTFQANTGQSACVSCAPGTFSDTTGSIQCSSCTANSIAPSGGSSSCTACPDGTESSDGVNCRAVTPGTTGQVTLTLWLEDENSELKVPEGTTAQVTCFPSASVTGSVSTFLQAGQSSTTFQVSAGSYDCQAVISPYVSNSVNIKVEAGQAISARLLLYKRDAQIQLRLVDSTTGEPLTGIAAMFTLWKRDNTDAIVDLQAQSVSNGAATFNVIDGITYEASVQSPDGELLARIDTTQEPIYYIFPSDLLRFTPDSESIETIDFVLSRAHAGANVRILNSSGVVVKNGFVEAFSPASLETSLDAHLPKQTASEKALRTSPPENFANEHWIGQMIDPSGATFLPLIAGRRYDLNGTDFQLDRSSEAQSVTLNEDEIKSIDLVIDASNEFSVQIEALNPEISQFERLWCYASRPGITSATRTSEDGITVGLSLRQPERFNYWQIACQAVGQPGDAEKRYYAGRVTTKIDAKNAEKINIPLQAGLPFYEEEAYELSTSTTNTVYLPDGKSKIDFPQNSLSQPGSLRVVVKSASDYEMSETEFPTLAYKISLFLGDSPVTELDKPVRLSLPIDESWLAALRAIGADVVPAHYNEDYGVWQRIASFSYFPEEGRFVIPVKNFSVWGLLVDLSKQIRRSSPSGLKARMVNYKGKKATVSLKWRVPKELSDSTFEVVLQKVSKRELKQHNEYRQSTPIMARKLSRVVGKTEVNIPLTAGTYKFKVRFQDGLFFQSQKV